MKHSVRKLKRKINSRGYYWRREKYCRCMQLLWDKTLTKQKHTDEEVIKNVYRYNRKATWYKERRLHKKERVFELSLTKEAFDILVKTIYGIKMDWFSKSTASALDKAFNVKIPKEWIEEERSW